jgi:hypothetical protein
MNRRPTKDDIDSFAQGVAVGMCVKHAALAAGYSPETTSFYKRARSPAFIARVAQLREETHWDGTRDVSALLRALKRAFEAAVVLKNGSGLAAAAQMVAHAAKLKKELPSTVRGAMGAFQPHPWDRFAP